MTRMRNQYLGRQRSLAPATDKQVDYLKSLLAQRHYTDDLSVEDQVEQITTLHAQGKLGKYVATNMIQKCLTSPRRMKPSDNQDEMPTPESGIYTRDGSEIIKVYKGQSGRMLAKQLIQQHDESYKFQYKGAATAHIVGMHKMTLTEAKQYGAIYGVCCNCGATLTDETSIERGIGPKCAKGFS